MKEKVQFNRTIPREIARKLRVLAEDESFSDTTMLCQLVLREWAKRERKRK